jgi:hypothetical protein
MASREPKKTWPFICPHCEQASTAVVCGKAYWSGGDHGPPVEWTMVQCERCSQPAVQLREDYGGGFAEDGHPMTIYPAPIRLSTSIPADLRREWEEAQTCFQAKAYAACVATVRRTLEGTCVDQGVSGKTLARNLSSSPMMGTLTKGSRNGRTRCVSLETGVRTTREALCPGRTRRMRSRSPRHYLTTSTFSGSDLNTSAGA